LSQVKSDNEGFDAMPQIDLNPLANPLLSQHMGRWAEVYFTNPPEKRDEAVLQLLLDLAREGMSENAPAQIADAPEGISEGNGGRTCPIFEPISQARPCASCGAQISAQQSFCGTCGASVDASPDNGVQNQHTNLDSSQPRTLSPSFELADLGEDSTANEPTTWDLGGEAPKFLVHEGLPYRYRIYAGVAIALLLGVLGYGVWHGTRNWPGASRNLPQTATATPSDEPSKPQPPPPGATNNDLAVEKHQPAEPQSAAQGADSEPPEPKNAESSETASSSPTNTPAPPLAERAAKVDALQHGTGNPSTGGSEELAMAENYLGNKAGTARDSGEAAKWLWKALAKQNTTAAVLLSDLYLKGDGVPKNCDQARLLLDASARKRTPGAAERIRNLQAFGCQ